MRVAIITLGCKVNQYDSATLETQLQRAGCVIAPFAPGADVYVVNSCTVTDRADAESRQLARRARRFNPAARIVMTGCFAQVNPRAAALPEVDHVVGLNRLPDLLRAVHGELAVEERIVVDDLRAARRVRTLGAETFTGQTRAFLKVQEGCDLFCTFCIVPFARGRSRSVTPRAVLAQVEVLAARGFQEVVLTGVHLGGYGADLTPRLGLADLVEMLVERAAVPRLRLSSVDPPEVTPRLLALMAGSSVLCPHLHVPVQSGDDGVLRRMRRQYDTAFLHDLGAEIRHRLPDAAVGTDVIAGFPGESEGAAEATCRVLAELPVTYLHVFPYSRRSGTTAAKFADALPPGVVRRRARRLRALDERKRADFAARFVGRDLQVLVEHGASDWGCGDAQPGANASRAGASAGSWAVGYSRNYQRVELPAGSALANREVAVRILRRRAARLVGVPVGG